MGTTYNGDHLGWDGITPGRIGSGTSRLGRVVLDPPKSTGSWDNGLIRNRHICLIRTGAVKIKDPYLKLV